MKRDDGVHPPAHVRVILAEYRRQGIEFEEAWQKALRSLPRGSDKSTRVYWQEWREILRWAEPWYEAAFKGWEQDFTEVFIALQTHLEPEVKERSRSPLSP